MNSITKTIDSRILTPVEDELFYKRKIFISKDINNETAKELLMNLIYLEESDVEEPVTIYINSPGGEVKSGLALYDYIRTMKKPVVTVCCGVAASMSSILFLAGDKRIMYEHGEIMVHDPIATANKTFKPMELQEKAEELMDLRSKLANIISDRTNLSKEQVLKLTKKDTYIGATDALKYNIATEVIKIK